MTPWFWRFIGASVLSFALAVPALAQTTADARQVRQPSAPVTPPDAEQQQQKPANPPPANIPLFPKHRRGLYRNGLGLWVIDAPPQSPPLETDDPGVPDKGVYEINFTTSVDRTELGKKLEFVAVDANYGLLPRVFGHEVPTQFKIEAPIAGSKATGQAYGIGPGPVGMGLKLNFYSDEDNGIALSFYPQIEFALGSGSVDKGLAESGQALIFPVLASKEFHYVTIVANGSVHTPVNDPDRDVTAAIAVSIGVPITRKFAAMAEIRGEAPFGGSEGQLVTINGGIMRAVGHYSVVYANIGRTLVSDDGVSHVFAGVGMKFLITPAKGKTKR